MRGCNAAPGGFASHGSDPIVRLSTTLNLAKSTSKATAPRASTGAGSSGGSHGLKLTSGIVAGRGSEPPPLYTSAPDVTVFPEGRILVSRLASVARSFLCLALLVLVCTRSDVAGQTARANVRVDREYTLESTMVGYRGVGGEIDGVRNPDVVGPHGRDGAHQHRQRRADGARHRARESRRQESADSGQGRDDEHHVQSRAQRHLLLHGAGPPAGGHGGPARRVGRAADQLRGCRADARRASAQSGLRSRDARSTGRPTGDAFSLVKADRKAPELKDARDGRGGLLLGQQPARRRVRAAAR